MTYSVLVVDDNITLANLYQIVFERVGWLMRRVSSGQEALDSLVRDVPDVILLDVMMPEMDGIEACRRIRRIQPERPPSIVIYSANNRPEVREQILAAGADAFFSKNLSVFDLPSHILPHLPSPAPGPATA